jgi:hypothetical protein
MGFLNKAFRKVKKQIQPGNMIARDMGPGNMPRRPDIFGDSFLFGRKPDMTLECLKNVAAALEI